MKKDDIVLKAVALLITKMEIKLTMPEDEIVK
jgi:CRP-like cAMP-binding protein